MTTSQNPVVSVMIPCYNMERKMSRFMESLLCQTYRSLELLFVDDGSTDGTKAFIFSYAERFAGLGMAFRYLYQVNQGLAPAIAHGLREATGEYLIWPDPDDWLEPDSIEKRLRVLQAHPEYGCVTSNAWLHRENALDENNTKLTPGTEKDRNPEQFALLLNSDSIFCCGCHMLRTAALDQANPGRYLYPARRGQNFQMLLPVYYRYKRYFLDECLYHYVNYSDSMSHDDLTLSDRLTRQDGILDILLDTLEHIGMPDAERDACKAKVNANDAAARFRMACDHHDRALMEQQYARLNALGALTARQWLRCRQEKSTLIGAGVKVLKKLLKSARP